MFMMRHFIVTLSLGLASAAYAEPAAAPDPSTVASKGLPVAAQLPLLTSATHSMSLRRHLASRARHDSAAPVVRTAQSSAHELPADGVIRVAAASGGSEAFQRVAILDRTTRACDSLLCPGYAILGVGF